MKNDVWVLRKDVPADKAPSWKSRRIMAYGDEIMCVENIFDPGEEAPLHNHPHSQIAYIVSGKFEFVVGDERRTVEEGDSVFFPPEVYHSVTCIESGLIVDVFSPMREDFVK